MMIFEESLIHFAGVGMGSLAGGARKTFGARTFGREEVGEQ